MSKKIFKTVTQKKKMNPNESHLLAITHDNIVLRFSGSNEDICHLSGYLEGAGMHCVENPETFSDVGLVFALRSLKEDDPAILEQIVKKARAQVAKIRKAA